MLLNKVDCENVNGNTLERNHTTIALPQPNTIVKGEIAADFVARAVRADVVGGITSGWPGVLSTMSACISVMSA